jgi:amidase
MYKELWDEGLVQGLPVNIQIVTGRFGEEKAVGVAKVLEKLGIV